MKQASLFDGSDLLAAPTVQETELARVSGKIGAVVEKFCRERLRAGRPEFFISELHEFVRHETQIAPASPDRILRELRLRGVVNYEVISRRESKYRIISVRETA